MNKKKHGDSILQKRDRRCYLCQKLDGNYNVHDVIHKHHVFGGPNRQISEKEGFTVDLCMYHHTVGTKAVHNNIENSRILQRDCQRKYEETHTREEFMSLIGRNYLEDQWQQLAKEEANEELEFYFLEEEDK